MFRCLLLCLTVLSASGVSAQVNTPDSRVQVSGFVDAYHAFEFTSPPRRGSQLYDSTAASQ